MKLAFPKFQLALVFVFAAVIAGAATLITWSQTPSFCFEVSMRSSTPGLAQTFYDIGQGLREEDSVRLQLQAPQASTVYRFPLPEAEYRAIRFDPLDHGNADLVIDFARIVDISGRTVRDFTIQELTIGGGISASNIADGKRSLTLGPADIDSILVINLANPLALHLAPSTRWLFFARSFVAKFLPSGALGGLWVILAGQLSSPRARHRWSRLSALAQLRPGLTLLFVAGAAVIVSCYPVVFCGRSFVSANNASLLYPNSPTVPGYQNTELENFRGSDTGAMMWQNVPYSFVQNRSITRYGELPLWNRFHSCGTPLLGQGLSMFGDPLHMMVVAAGGSALAWDAKFLLAKLLFCWALGLLVFAAVRHLPTALFLAASAAFLGFFSYRFDHPAFFSVCYAPWILYCWFRVKEAVTSKQVVTWIIGLLVACWTELNSGTVKEAYMLLLAMNGCGLLVVLFNREPLSLKLKKLASLCFGGLLFVAISMPIWLTFLDALRIAFTAYNSPGVWNIPPSLFLGIFDDMFYREVTVGESVYTPSTNFFVLLGFVLALGHLRTLLRDPTFRAVATSALVAFAMAFSIVPPSLLVKIPFIGNIIHIGNTFSCVLVVYLFLLAGFGVRTFWQQLSGTEWKAAGTAAFLPLALLSALYVGFVQASSPDSPALRGHKILFSTFFNWYAPTLLIAVVALPFIARSIVRHPRNRIIMVPLLLAFLFLLHWRHGFHLKTGLPQIDDYVVNPLVRAEFDRPSGAVSFVKAQPGLYRTLGFDGILFPGYNSIVGLESIYGTDPLNNSYYRQLLLAGGVKLDWSWRWIVEKTTLKGALPVYSLLNARYFLSLPQDEPTALPSLDAIGSFDLSVLKNEKAWPRAFFVDKLFIYETGEQFVQMLRRDESGPLAAVQRDDTTAVSATAPLQAPIDVPRHVIEAKDFKLTNNTTTFVVDAPGPGVVVLTETYTDGEDFRATLNGRLTNYFRVNHAFRGLTVPSAGTYRVSFSYWPKHFTLSLTMCGVGLFLLAAWLAVTFFFLPRWGAWRGAAA